MDDLLHASHTVHEVKAHYVWSLKYRKNLLYKEEYKNRIKELVNEIGERYWYRLIKIGTDGNHIHLLIQSNPDDSFSKIVKTIKSISAREMFKTYPELKKLMWGASLWETGYFVRTVGDETTTKMIQKYIEKQGRKRNVKAEQIIMF